MTTRKNTQEAIAILGDRWQLSPQYDRVKHPEHPIIGRHYMAPGMFENTTPQGTKTTFADKVVHAGLFLVVVTMTYLLITGVI